MVQRKAAAKAKSALNGVAKKETVKTPKKALKTKQIIEEEEEPVMEIVKAPKGRKGAKGKATAAAAAPPPPPQIVETDDSESELEEKAPAVSADEEDDENVSDASGLIDNEASEAEDDEEDKDSDIDDNEDGEVPAPSDASDNDDDDDDAEADDAEGDDDDDDEAPVEQPIQKKAKSETIKSGKGGGIPKIQVGKVPEETPKEQVVFVSNLPEKYQLIELIEVFGKFGTITLVDRIKGKGNKVGALIVFNEAKSAEAAIAAKDLKLQEQTLKVSVAVSRSGIKERDRRTIVISCLGPNATTEQLKEHFGNCGEIEEATLSKNINFPYGFVRFQSHDSIAEALKLDNSTLNNRILSVRAKEQTVQKSVQRTVVVANSIDAESYNSDEIRKIFKKINEIEDIEIICTKTTLAFVTFKTEEGAKEAFKLNGKTVNGLELKLEHFAINFHRTTLVTNLSPATTEQDLQELFSTIGEIEHIWKFKGRALIKFKSSDAFCKSFLLNETVVKGRPIFLEPNSKLKLKLRNAQAFNRGTKKAGQKNHFNGPPQNKNFNGPPQNKFNGPPQKGGFNGPRKGGPNNFINNRGPGGNPNKRQAQDDNNKPFYKRARNNAQ